MKKTGKILMLLPVLALAALACQVLGGGTDTGGGSPTPASAVLFKDDFSDKSGGWAEQSDAEGITDYENGGYRIKVDKPSWYFWTNPGLSFTDTSIEVDATKLGGPDDNEFGVICRYVDAYNFYYLTISSDGYYGISKFIDDELSLIGTENLEYSDAIHQGAATNHLRADCVGSILRLYANGTLLLETQDTDLASGDIGMIAGTFDEPGTDVLFDNLVVNKP